MTASKRKTSSRPTGRNKVSEVIPAIDSSSSSSSTEEITGSLGSGVNLTISKKTNKPLMEKRRRARINESLALLKELVVVEADNPSKLEKADILELTVKRVRELCNFQATAQDAFQEGFERCLGAATGFLEDSGFGDLSHRLTSHVRSGTDSTQTPQDLSTTVTTAAASPFPHPIATNENGSDNPGQSHPLPEDLLNEPINLTLLGTNVSRSCGVWRPW